MGAIDPAAYRQGAEAVWLADQRDRVAAIAVPTLVLVGAEDKATPPALSEDLAGAIPGARLEIVSAYEPVPASRLRAEAQRQRCSKCESDEKLLNNQWHG